jgi:hypothetical protein
MKRIDIIKMKKTTRRLSPTERANKLVDGAVAAFAKAHAEVQQANALLESEINNDLRVIESVNNRVKDNNQRLNANKKLASKLAEFVPGAEDE